MVPAERIARVNSASSTAWTFMVPARRHIGHGKAASSALCEGCSQKPSILAAHAPHTTWPHWKTAYSDPKSAQHTGHSSSKNSLRSLCTARSSMSPSTSVSLPAAVYARRIFTQTEKEAEKSPIPPPFMLSPKTKKRRKRKPPFFLFIAFDSLGSCAWGFLGPGGLLQRAREAPVQAQGRDRTEVRARKLVPRARPDAPVRAVAEAHANGLSVALALGPRQTSIAQIEVQEPMAPGSSVIDTKSAAQIEEDE